MTTDFERQRLAMVESQVRPNNVTDRRLLVALRGLPRESFVPPALRALAYMDGSIEVFPSIDGAPARFLLAPMVLARLGHSVIGLEPEPELAGAAERALDALSIENATIVNGELAAGYAEAAPYDVVLLNGSVPAVSETLLSQLKEGGRLAAVVTGANSASQGKAYLFVKVGKEASGVPHFDAGAKPLPGFAPKPSFVF